LTRFLRALVGLFAHSFSSYGLVSGGGEGTVGILAL